MFVKCNAHYVQFPRPCTIELHLNLSSGVGVVSIRMLLGYDSPGFSFICSPRLLWGSWGTLDYTAMAPPSILPDEARAGK